MISIALDHLRDVRSQDRIVGDGQAASQVCVVLSGLLHRSKILADGARQIISFHVPGDMPDLSGLMWPSAHSNLSALTHGSVALIAHSDLDAAMRAVPSLAQLFWRVTLVDAAILAEWVVNLGARDAHGRIAHLLCEMFLRMKGAGLVTDGSFEAPMTQLEIGEATGLAAVHVNRVLQRLRSEGLITLSRRHCRIDDWAGLSAVAGFDPAIFSRRPRTQRFLGSSNYRESGKGSVRSVCPSIDIRHLVYHHGAALAEAPVTPSVSLSPLNPTRPPSASVSHGAPAPLGHDPGFKARAYAALRAAILQMNIYGSPHPVMLDERDLSDRLGVSRTPVREAVAMLEQEGFVRTLPRRGVLVLRKTAREIVEMIEAWAALESMAVRLLVARATDAEIAGLRGLFAAFDQRGPPEDTLADYSAANLAFHQAIIRLSGSQVLAAMTDNLVLHVRGIRQLTIGRDDRARTSLSDHLAIIGAIEARDTLRAERLSRDHTLGLAAYVTAHGAELFN